MSEIKKHQVVLQRNTIPILPLSIFLGDFPLFFGHVIPTGQHSSTCTECTNIKSVSKNDHNLLYKMSLLSSRYSSPYRNRPLEFFLGEDRHWL